jgi:hypothetical protein
MIIKKPKFMFILNKHVFLIKWNNICLYFPSSFWFGTERIKGSFRNWSFLKLTLEYQEDKISFN